MTNEQEQSAVQRVVVNSKNHAGFSLSEKAVRWLCEHGYEEAKEWVLVGEEHPKEELGEYLNAREPQIHDPPIDRDDPHLIAVVEELGKDAGGGTSELEVVEIPGDVEWQIEGWDGLEWVAEKHRTWP